jgi:hypothetical protein
MGRKRLPPGEAREKPPRFRLHPEERRLEDEAARRRDVQRGTFHAMAARRSFNRSIEKFELLVVDRIVAIITAIRGEVPLVDNRKANAQLEDDLKELNLGFYPVKGAGQEERRWLFGLLRYVVPSSEESLVVQPRGELMEAAFVSVIQRLLHKYGQFVAMMKLPSSPQAFLLHADGSRENKGSGAGPTTPQDDYYTQLRGGPRAHESMLRPWEIQGERNPFRRLFNAWGGRSFMNHPADRSKIGQRFSIKETPQLQELEET